MDCVKCMDILSHKELFHKDNFIDIDKIVTNVYFSMQGTKLLDTKYQINTVHKHSGSYDHDAGHMHDTYIQIIYTVYI